METFTARNPVDLLALVPFVIGFHPEDSIVLLTVGASPAGRFGGRPESFHARVDLPRIDVEQREVARMLRSVIAHHGADAIGLVLYTDDASTARLFAEAILPGLESDGVDVIDLIRVDGERYYAVDEVDDPGTAYDLSGHPFTARGVLEGRVVHPSRSALRDSLVGIDEDDVAEVSAAATAIVDALAGSGVAGESLHGILVDHARWLDGRIAEYIEDHRPVTVEDAALLLVLVSFEALREVAWAAMSRACARQHVELWRDLVRRAPADLRAGASGLLAFAAWLAGDGALAWCAIDRCLESDTDDLLAHHVAGLVETATPPTVWTSVPLESLRIFTTFGSDVP